MSILGIESINPHLRVALRSELPKGTAIAPRVIFDYELIFIERGEFIFGYGGRSYRASEGSFLLISPGVTHSFDCSLSDISQPHIHFDMTYSQASRERFICYKDLPDLSAKERELISEDILPNGREPFVLFESTDAPKELLRTKSVTEVAYTLGYSSIYSFSRAYKNKFGYSPREAKK